MPHYRIVDLSLPIINGGGFAAPARIKYIDHRARGKMLSDKLDIQLNDMGGKANAMEEFDYLNCHIGTHFDAPWHYTDTVNGKPAMTIDQIPLEWCFGDGAWIDLSFKKPGEDITADNVQEAFQNINYTLKSMDIVFIKTGASAYYGQPGCENMNAGMTREATLWLSDQGIRLVGIDASCWDCPPQLQLNSLQKGDRKGKYMQGHRAAGERGMCIVEWITNLDLLPHYGFSIYAFPVKIQSASAGWVRVVALVEESNHAVF